jgi:hypothetical protein
LSDTPREFPTRTANTVERAKKLKIDVDNKTETLLSSSLMLSETAKPVIDKLRHDTPAGDTATTTSRS